MIIIRLARWIDEITLRAWLFLSSAISLKERSFTLIRLAKICLDKGESSKAESYLKEAVEIGSSDRGLMASLYSGLGFVRSQLGDHRGGAKWHRKAYQINREVFGDSHPGTMDSMDCLASMAIAMGEDRQAVGLLEKLFDELSQSKDRVSKDEARLAWIAESLGRTYLKLDDLVNAKRWYRKVLSLAESGSDAKALRGGLLNVAAICALAGHYEEAESLLDRSDESASGDVDRDHLGRSMEVRLEGLMSRERWIAAKELSERLMEHWEQAGRYDRAAEAERALGEILPNMGLVDDGLRHLRGYASRMQRALGEAHPRALEALEIAAEAHRKYGRTGHS